MLIEGPYFVYDHAPKLFSGRKGRGALEIVWDTNILLDYLEHGSSIWEEEEFQTSDEDYYAELEGLGLLINLWTRRDIRFHVLERSVTDAKKGLPDARRAQRRRVIDEVAQALFLDSWADEVGSINTPPPRWAADPLPKGADRELVQIALDRGTHVFLTRDAQVLKCARYLTPMGLFLASPLDVVEELLACGAMEAVMRPETMHWPLPDLQRASHLIHALDVAG